MAEPDLLTPLDPDTTRLHPGFVTLANSPGYAPARPLIRDIWEAYVDTDGNFIEQFQTTGFDARIWELFLFAFLNDDAQATFNWEHQTPDFLVEINGVRLGIEAVTANPSQDPVVISAEAAVDDPMEKMRHAYPIRLGSALYSKLQKRYWELPQLDRVPLVLAIQDFHEEGSLYASSASMWQYLYGIVAKWYHDEDGRLHIDEIPIDQHSLDNKVIPSGFFDLPDAEHISAVLFGNSGTVAKFNRLGYRLGYGAEENLTFLWHGFRYNHEPEQDVPVRFVYELGQPDVPEENWGHGLTLFHNPRAVLPLPYDILNCGFALVDDSGLRSFFPDFHPFSSQTITIMARPRDEGAEGDADAEDQGDSNAV